MAKFLLPGLAISLFVSVSACWAGENRAAWKLERFSTDTAALLKAAADLKSPTDAEVVVLDDEADCRFEADGRATFTWYLVYRILNQKGIEGWDGVSVSWEPWHDERPSIRARVITPDNAIHNLDPKTITDSPAQDDANNIYGDRRVVRAPLPAIAVESIVEEEETVKENAPLFGAGIVRRQPFGRFIPVQHSSPVLDAPSSLAIRYNLQLLPDLKPQRMEENGRVRLVFDSGPMEALTEIDRYLPGNVMAYPSVIFSTGTPWQ